MKFQITCDHCGHVRTCYTHNLNKQLVSGLRMLVDFYARWKRGANLQKDLQLDVNLNNNFQKLQYFDLAFRTKEGWFPSTYGIEFIHGDKYAPNMVATIDSEPIGMKHEAWKTHGTKPEFVHVKDIDITAWKKRDEYQEEKSKQNRML